MPALAADRSTPRMDGPSRLLSYGAKGATKVYAGALVVLAAGLAKGGAAATGLVAVGRADRYVDNSAGADGDLQVPVQTGIFRFDNSSAGDAIAIGDISADCYVVDDHTVAKTDGS